MTKLTTDKLKHLTNKAVQVSKIIIPMRTVDIVGVFYTRIYPDGTAINLASDVNWTELYFNQLSAGAYQNKDVLDKYFTHSGVSLWALNPTNQIWQDGKNYFNYGNGVTISNDCPGFRETISFYSTSDNHAINYFYINKTDELRKVKEYFLLQAATLIQEAERERLLMPFSLYCQRNVEENTCDLKFDAYVTGKKFQLSSMDNFSQRICLIHKKTHLPMQLSPQRGQCFLLLLEGKSIKEIAFAMNLNPKTIEHYLELLRKELGCRSSKELIAFYSEQLAYRGISPY